MPTNVQIFRFNAEQEGVGEQLFFGPTITVKNCVDQGTKKGISCGIRNPTELATKSLDCNSDAPIPTTLCTVRVDPQKSTNV